MNIHGLPSEPPPFFYIICFNVPWLHSSWTISEQNKSPSTPYMCISSPPALPAHFALVSLLRTYAWSHFLYIMVIEARQEHHFGSSGVISLIMNLFHFTANKSSKGLCRFSWWRGNSLFALKTARNVAMLLWCKRRTAFQIGGECNSHICTFP